MATLISPGATEAHLKFDLRTGRLIELLYFTDEGTVGKCTPQCCIVRASLGLTGWGREFLRVIPTHSQKVFYLPSCDERASTLRTPTREVLKDPPHMPYRVKQ